MSRVAEMRRLTEDLRRSREERMADLAAGRLQVQDALSDAHQRLAAQRNHRHGEAKTLRSDLATDAATRQRAVTDAIGGFAKARSAMASGQRVALAEVTALRRHFVSTTRTNTVVAMRALGRARADGEARVKAELRHQRGALAQRVQDLMGTICHDRAIAAAGQRETLNHGRTRLAFETADLLGQTATARCAMAKVQGEKLRSEGAALRAEVMAALGGFRADRQALASSLVEFRNVWQIFTAAEPARPSHAAGSPAPAPESAPATSAAPVATATGAPAGEVPGDVHPFPADDVVFSYLADHPDGVRLVELEQHFGVARIRLAQTMSRLIEENKARKDDDAKLYFAT